MEELNNIREMIDCGDVCRAIEALDSLISRTSSPSDELYYLRGNAYRKQGNWHMALNNYLEAMEINPEGPASNAYKMAMDILEFYNKDMFNQ